MKTASLFCCSALVLAGTLAAQTPPPEKREPQDLQLSKSRGTAAAPKQDPTWPPKGPTPRTADGHPDLTGNWQPNAIRQNVDMVGAGVEVPCCPRPERSTKNTRRGREDPEARCLPPGVPRMSTTPYPWSFIQTER